MKSLLSRSRTILFEILVIVIGILLAFQVEEWRENRAEQRDLQAALERLAQETDRNLDLCKYVLPRTRNNAEAMAVVWRSLHSGSSGPRR